MKYIYLILLTVLFIGCTPSKTPKTGKDLLALTVTYLGTDYNATIGASTVSFSGLVVTGEMVTIKSFTVSEGASLKADATAVTVGASTLNPGETTFVVTAEDGTTKLYVVSIIAKQVVPTKYATANASVLTISNVDYTAVISNNIISFNNVVLSGTEFVVSGGSLAISGVTPSFILKSVDTTPTLKTDPSATEGAIISVSGTPIILVPGLTIPITQSVVPINVSAVGYLTTSYIVRLNITSPEVPDGYIF